SYLTCRVTWLFFLLLLPRPPISTLFPYTTLFRSGLADLADAARLRKLSGVLDLVDDPIQGQDLVHDGRRRGDQLQTILPLQPLRSEEHTSELQSRENLVCRLLLEKKKKKNRNN